MANLQFLHFVLPWGPSLYYVSPGTGWVGSEKWQFLLTFSTIYADVVRWVDGWVRKSLKMCWRNIGMVPCPNPISEHWMFTIFGPIRLDLQIQVKIRMIPLLSTYLYTFWWLIQEFVKIHASEFVIEVYVQYKWYCKKMR